VTREESPSRRLKKETRGRGKNQDVRFSASRRNAEESAGERSSVLLLFNQERRSAGPDLNGWGKPESGRETQKEIPNLSGYP